MAADRKVLLAWQLDGCGNGTRYGLRLWTFGVRCALTRGVEAVMTCQCFVVVYREYEGLFSWMAVWIVRRAILHV